MSSELDLLATTDCTKWAAEFCRIFKKNGHGDIDEGWMQTWFASAIERGRSNPHPTASPVPPAVVVPEGMALVPIEPTYAMVQAGAKLVKENLPFHTGTLAIYKAMLNAHPEPTNG